MADQEWSDIYIVLTISFLGAQIIGRLQALLFQALWVLNQTQKLSETI